MSGIATAVIGGAIISGVVAKGAADDAKDANEANMDFSEKQYNDWKDIYGPIEQNLANYYGSLSADTYAAQGVQNIEEEYAVANERLEQNLAQRGITGGIVADVQKEQEFAMARDKATVRTNADEAVANQQMNFLSVGQGNNPSNTHQQVLSNNANRLNEESYAANDAFASGVSSAVNTGLGMLNKTPTGADGQPIT